MKNANEQLNHLLSVKCSKILLLYWRLAEGTGKISGQILPGINWYQVKCRLALGEDLAERNRPRTRCCFSDSRKGILDAVSVPVLSAYRVGEWQVTDHLPA